MTDETQPTEAPASMIGRLRAGAGSAAGSVVDAAVAGLRELPGRRVRRVRRSSHDPLPSLPDLHPEARNARPVDVGMRTIDVEDIRGTAVGGGDQRGADFLPLKAFRSKNWSARWQRLRRANDRLASLPPIDVVKYDGAYWVIDGHNRVGLALYEGQVGIDASVTELVKPGERRTEPIGSLSVEVEASRTFRSMAAADDDASADDASADDASADDASADDDAT